MHRVAVLSGCLAFACGDAEARTPSAAQGMSLVEACDGGRRHAAAAAMDVDGSDRLQLHACESAAQELRGGSYPRIRALGGCEAAAQVGTTCYSDTSGPILSVDY